MIGTSVSYFSKQASNTLHLLQSVAHASFNRSANVLDPVVSPTDEGEGGQIHFNIMAM